MDNFRKLKSNKSARGAVDGIVRSAPKGRSRSRLNLSNNTQPKAVEPVGRVGNFGTSDGFTPNKQSQIRTGVGQTIGRKPNRRDDGTIDLDLPASPDVKKFRERTKSHRGRSALKRGSSLFAACLILFSGFVFGRVYLKASQIFQGGGGAIALNKNVDPSLLKGEGDGRVNILMLGKGGVGHEGADLTDTVLVASLNPIQKEAAIVSIPRDLYVKTPEDGSMKINAVYSSAKMRVLNNSRYNDSSRESDAEKAGLEAIDNIVEGVLGIPIHYDAMVDFDGFKQAIDTVDGIDLNAPSDVAEYMWLDGRNYHLDVQPGQQHFDGFRALAYARSRHTSPRGDFDRSERQRLIMVALKDKVLTLGTLANPIKINQLIGNFGDHVHINMTVDELMRLYDIGKDIDSSKIQSVGLADPPNDYVRTGNMNGLSIVLPKAGLNNYKDIQSFIRNKLKDGYLADENATVLVLNGTNTPGLAGRTTDELKSFGYNLLQATDAPTKGYSNTVLVDLRSGEKKYTKRYLEQRFGTTAVPNLPDSTIAPLNADFVIIIGQNEVSRLQN